MRAMLARTATVLGVLRSTSLVTFAGAPPASAYSSGPGLGVPAPVMDAAAASFNTAFIAGTGVARAGASALLEADLRSVATGVVATGGGALLDVAAGIGTTVAGVGAAIGLGHLPGLHGIFGSGTSVALPSYVAATADGQAGAPGAGNLVGSGTCAAPTMYPTGSAPAGYTMWSATQGAASGGFRILWTTGTSGCAQVGGSSNTGSYGFTLTLPAGQRLVSRRYYPSTSYYEFSAVHAPATGIPACIADASTNGAQTQFLQPGFSSVGQQYWMEPTGGTPACTGTPVAYWSRSATPYGSTYTDTNPLRWIESKGTCYDATGAPTPVTVSSSTFARATGATGTQTTPDAPEITCPAGQFLGSASAEIVTSGPGGQAVASRVPVMAPCTMPADVKNLLTGPASGCLTTACQLHVQRVSPALDCSSVALTDSHPCYDWAHAADYPANWTCMYGPATVPLASCSSLQTFYRATPVMTPNTGAGVVALPATTPTTGFPATGTNTDPTTGTDSTDTTHGVNPDTGDAAGASCMGGAWSWNPVNWVYIPVKCALKWAFVPPAGSMETQFTGLRTTWSASPPGAYLAGFGSMIGAFGSIGSGAGGCMGPAVTLSALDMDTVHPLAACDDPMHQIAVVVRIGLLIVVYAGAAVLAARMLAASLGLDLPRFGGSE